MACTEEPYIYSFARVSIRAQNSIYIKYFGNAPVFWDSQTIRLKSLGTKNLRRFSPWLIQHILGLIIYGFILSVWCLLYAENVSIVNYFVFGIILSFCIFQIGVGYKLYFHGDDNIFGVNALLDYHCYLTQERELDWMLLADRWHKIIQFSGFVLCNGIIVAIGSTGFAWFAVAFDFDLLYFPFWKYVSKMDYTAQNIFIGIRILAGLFYCLCASRIVCLLFTHVVLVCQAYLVSWALIPKITNFRVFVKEYRKLSVIHTRISSFANTLCAFMLFMGHTFSTSLYWVGIRGWDLAPNFVVAMFAICGVGSSLWVILALSVFSRIHTNSKRAIENMSRRAVFEGRRRNREEIRVYVATMTPMSFRSGSCFTITKESPGSFLMTAISNLTTAVLTF